MKITATLNGESFTVELADSETARAFAQTLPLSATLDDLHGNEKYVWLDAPLPVDSYQPNRIEAGDVMLFQDNCLVIFYESFSTSYSYTKIGRIEDASELASVVGSGSVNASFTQ